MAKYTLSVLVENHAGVLSRVSGLFSRRGFNIDSLAVGSAETPDLSRITIVVDGDEYIVDQVRKQLSKLVDVRRVQLLDPNNSVARELVMIKVKVSKEKRPEVVQLVDIFRAKIIDVSTDTLTVLMTGEGNKTEALLTLLDDYGILEIARTGILALERGLPVHDDE